MSDTTMPSDEELLILRNKVDSIYCVAANRQTREGYEKSLNNIMSIIATALHEAEVRGQNNGVKWSVGVIDKMHNLAHINDDSMFKGIKNTLRDRYKSETGIDPAPNYPIEVNLATLSAERKEEV